MDKKLKNAYIDFYEHNYDKAIDCFFENELYFEAGMCAFLKKDLPLARKLFEKKEKECLASNFGISIIDILENKTPKKTKYFQIRAFLEIFLNLLIENRIFDWAQTIVNKSNYFTCTNTETPKFIARVLWANGHNRAIHKLAAYAKEMCKYDAEIYYIDADVYKKEENYKKALDEIKKCIAFAPEYYPILCLKKEVETLENKNGSFLK